MAYDSPTRTDGMAKHADLSGASTSKSPSVKPVQVVQKARRVLDAFSLERPQLALPEIARAAGLPTSTCFRLLQTLTAEGFLDRDGDRYRPGVGLLQWAALVPAGRDLIAAAQPILDRLRDGTGESACLYVRDGLLRTCVAVAPTRHNVVRQLYVGKVMPLAAGSGGKVLIAYDPELIDEVLSGELNAYTPTTIADPTRLAAHLAEVRDCGYAVSFEERDVGASSISAPVRDVHGRVIAALGIAAPTQRLNPQTAASLINPTIAAAASLSAAMGHGREEVAVS